MILNKLKHLAHCVLFLVFIFGIFGLLKIVSGEENFHFNPWELYGTVGYSILFALRLLVLLSVPHNTLNFVGLICFNVFPGKVALRESFLLTPLICLRVVTRGDFPKLVRDNVSKNMKNCLEAGMDNFVIEVITGKPIGLRSNRRIREIVLPLSYTPKSGALYKARALQYCLEDEVNVLADDDYIVHLDEETIMTPNSIRGIINFVLDGKHDFGQGLITYTNGKVTNWITTLADSNRVADDMGKLRAQFYIFHKPIFSWKGSFMVGKVHAERDVSFDNGVIGSLAEDCYFAMKAYEKGYSFTFIDGEMWEKSPFTVWDFIQQRKRWMQGISWVVHAPEIPWKYKIWVSLSMFTWIVMPLNVSNIFLGILFPIPIPTWLIFLCSFVTAVNIYMYVFGVIKSLSVNRDGVFKYYFCIVAMMFNFFFATAMENFAALWGVFSQDRKFYVVKKETMCKEKDNLLTE